MSMPAERLTLAPNLSQLLQGMAAAPPLAVSGIASDSRRLHAGDVFLASRGTRSHGLDYVREALARKVAAVVWEPVEGRSFHPPDGVTAVPVEGLSHRLGTIANRWFDLPSASVRVSGVTGTNGKTTVAYLLAQCLQRLGRPAAYLGTLGAGIEEIVAASGLTTPDCVEVHRQLAEFRDSGATHVAMEVSSHGLSQHRVDGVRFDAALFTNLSRDHIDYHGSMKEYGDSKARLFLEHEPAHRVISVDSEFGVVLAARCGDSAVVTASDDTHDAGSHRFVFASRTQALPAGALVDIRSSWGTGRFRLPLVGAFNVANAMNVIALLLCYDIEFSDVLELMEDVTAPPGRMQQVAADANTPLPQVFVDYAHTPAALQAALGSLRPHCEGTLWCVFGCGGDRDRGKRPEMGDVASSLADHVIITSDNPRSEAPSAIIDDIRAGAGQDAAVIEDRAAAIAWAIGHAGRDDIVLVAGKGHESYQIIGNERLVFSDYLVAKSHLDARAQRRTPQ